MPACLCLLAQRLVVQVPAPFSRVHSNRSFGPGSTCYSIVTSSFPRASCNSPGTLALPSQHLSGSKIQAFLNPLTCPGRKVWSSITAHTLVCTPVTHRNSTSVPKRLPRSASENGAPGGLYVYPSLRSCLWLSNKHLQLGSLRG